MFSCSFVKVLKGPPLAVITILLIFSFPIFSTRLKIAECSESTGRIFAAFCLARFLINGPAITIVSLFASAMSILFSRTIFEGKSPAAPAIPFTTISGFDSSINISKACAEESFDVSKVGQL